MKNFFVVGLTVITFMSSASYAQRQSSLMNSAGTRIQHVAPPVVITANAVDHGPDEGKVCDFGDGGPKGVLIWAGNERSNGGTGEITKYCYSCYRENKTGSATGPANCQPK